MDALFNELKRFLYKCLPPSSDSLHGRDPAAPDLQQDGHDQELCQAVLQSRALWREHGALQEVRPQGELSVQVKVVWYTTDHL